MPGEEPEELERRQRRLEERDRYLVRDRDEEEAVLEEVFDRATLMNLYKLIRQGYIYKVYGAVSSGKESRIYWAKSRRGEDLAVKIYLTVTSAFGRKSMLRYIEGDPRFQKVKRDVRSLVKLWASKEFKNLEQAYDAGVRVPKPIVVRENVLVMEFIGEDGVPAPLLKDSILDNPEAIYRRILSNIGLLWVKAGIVHGDLSEYNIMVWRGEPVIFDLSQALSTEHPSASTLLLRDLKNINIFFSRFDLDLEDEETLASRILGGEIP
ncbi:MAG: serine protein kinase RIO [Candidatus Bathyarchaeota archaeon]|nr:serine protein kinase RIO [Candidatus Bathyarchaeota archaeon]